MCHSKVKQWMTWSNARSKVLDATSGGSHVAAHIGKCQTEQIIERSEPTNDTYGVNVRNDWQQQRLKTMMDRRMR